jgi:hypothetical protein
LFPRWKPLPGCVQISLGTPFLCFFQWRAAWGTQSRLRGRWSQAGPAPSTPTWASGAWAVVSWPCTVCPPAAGSAGSRASAGSRSNGTWSCPWKPNIPGSALCRP